MGKTFGLPSAIFALKCYVAAMLALYVSLSIGMERPYWAFLTAFIVAQPLAGAVLSKAVYRLIGTFAGAAASVAMVPPLVSSPELLTLAIASWLALCVFVSLLERTPRAYMFVLAGYSACIIALPSVDTPEQIFTIASLRVQEITIGILCASLVHGVILPGSATNLLLTRVTAMVRDAERWSADAISSEPQPGLESERRRLAADVTELHQLSTHLPFDVSRQAPRVRTVRALQDQLSMILPLGSAVQDRLETFRAAGGTPSAPLEMLIEDARGWLANPGENRDARTAAADALVARCAALEPEMNAEMDWREIMRLSLLARLATLIDVHRDCRDLLDQMTSPDRRAVTPRVAALLDGRRSREVHRDYAAAVRGASCAFITLVLGCVLWIGSGWADGSTAVMLAGVFLALFSAFDNPLPMLKGFMIGTLAASVIGALYGFVILPRLDGLMMLGLAFAPALLIGGALMASPRWGGIALPALLGMGSPALLSAQYSADFAGFVNGSIAQLVGVWFAILMASLLQSAGAAAAIRRIVRAGWTDIASRATRTTPPDVRGWINRMLDRAALLAPRIAVAGEENGALIYDTLRDMRTGVAVGELRQLRLALPREQSAPVAEVLRQVGDHYRRLDPLQPQPADPALLGTIDAAMAKMAANDLPDVRRHALLALVSLRRNLFPEATMYRSAAA